MESTINNYQEVKRLLTLYIIAEQKVIMEEAYPILYRCEKFAQKSAARMAYTKAIQAYILANDDDTFREKFVMLHKELAGAISKS
jgi:hypothetical protein